MDQNPKNCTCFCNVLCKAKIKFDNNGDPCEELIIDDYEIIDILDYYI